MSKKNVLNEVRRFMKLANLDANMSSNFITKIEEGEMPSYLRDDEGEELEDEIEVEADVDMDDGVEIEDEVEVEMDVDVEEEAVITDEEADILIALGQKLSAAQELGAEEEVEDALDDLDAADELEADAEEAEIDAAEDLEDAAEDLMQEDETLEEILDSILHEDSGEEEGRHYEDDEEADRKHMAALKKDIRYDDDHIDEEKDPNWGGNKGDYKRRKGKKVGDKDHHYKDYMEEDQGYDDKEDESLGMRRGKEADKKQSEKDRRDDSYGKWGSRNQRDRMRNRRREIPKLRNEDAVVQEVLKRVSARLAQMAKK